MNRICNDCEFCEQDSECFSGYYCTCQDSVHFEDCVEPEGSCEWWEERPYQPPKESDAKDSD